MTVAAQDLQRRLGGLGRRRTGCRAGRSPCACVPGARAGGTPPRRRGRGIAADALEHAACRSAWRGWSAAPASAPASTKPPSNHSCGVSLRRTSSSSTPASRSARPVALLRWAQAFTDMATPPRRGSRRAWRVWLCSDSAGRSPSTVRRRCQRSPSGCASPSTADRLEATAFGGAQYARQRAFGLTQGEIKLISHGGGSSFGRGGSYAGDGGSVRIRLRVEHLRVVAVGWHQRPDVRGLVDGDVQQRRARRVQQCLQRRPRRRRRGRRAARAMPKAVASAPKSGLSERSTSE